MLAVLVVSACTGDVISESTGLKEYPLYLHAGHAGMQSKITVDGTAVVWEEDDRLQIVAVSENEESGISELTWFSDVDGMDKHYASFSGFVTMTSQPKDCYFIYPVNQSTKVDGSTGNITLYYNNQSGRHEPFMYSREAYDAQGINTMLRHVGAMLEIDVQVEGVSQITFAGNRLEALSPIIVNSETGNVSYSTERNVQITVPVQLQGKTYIAVPPVALNHGFSLICSDSNGNNMIRTFSSNGSYDFSASVGQIIPITLSGTLENFEIAASEPVIEHTVSNGLLTGTSVKFKMTKKGASNKIIEEWGATLLNSGNEVVRKITKTDASINGETVALEIQNDWKLLPAGKYTFTPYYKIYGKTVSLNSMSVTVEDPGIQIRLSGMTSYDKYISGKISEANSHTNTLIESVSAEINVHTDILDSFTATVPGDGTNQDITKDGSNTLSFGNLTRTKWQSYDMTASATIGKIELTESMTFHITGLPYETDFTKGNPTGLSPAWYTNGTSYSNSRVVHNDSGNSFMRSPSFFIPQNKVIKVQTAVDCATNCTDNSDATLYANICTSTQSSAILSGSSVDINDYNYQSKTSAKRLTSKGYLYYKSGNTNIAFTLQPDYPHLSYSLNIDSSLGFLSGNIFVSFKYKIEYN